METQRDDAPVAAGETGRREDDERAGHARRLLRRRFNVPLWGLVLIAFLAVGAGGASGGTGVDRSELDAAHAKLADTRQEVADLKGKLATAESDARSADSRAVASARTKVEQEFASRAEALDARDKATAEKEAQLAAREQALTAAEVAKQRDTIDGDGTYEVGVDVNPGRYKTAGGEMCYWAKLRNDAGQDIIANDLGAGPKTAVLTAGTLFQSKGCGSWTRAG